MLMRMLMLMLIPSTIIRHMRIIHNINIHIIIHIINTNFSRKL